MKEILRSFLTNLELFRFREKQFFLIRIRGELQIRDGIADRWELHGKRNARKKKELQHGKNSGRNSLRKEPEFLAKFTRPVVKMIRYFFKLSVTEFSHVDTFTMA